MRRMVALLTSLALVSLLSTTIFTSSLYAQQPPPSFAGHWRVQQTTYDEGYVYIAVAGINAKMYLTDENATFYEHNLVAEGTINGNQLTLFFTPDWYPGCTASLTLGDDGNSFTGNVTGENCGQFLGPITGVRVSTGRSLELHVSPENLSAGGIAYLDLRAFRGGEPIAGMEIPVVATEVQIEQNPIIQEPYIGVVADGASTLDIFLHLP